MRFCVLASGSSGNSIWVEDRGAALVIDNGLSLSDFRRRTGVRGLDPRRIIGILVTHEHGDHIGGVGPLARACRAPVHGSPATLEIANGRGRLGEGRCRILSAGETASLGPFRVSAYSSSHDAADPQVYVLRSGGKAVGIATDLGVVTEDLVAAFSGLDAAVLEFNHDAGMLESGDYPVFLKRRVRGRKGHLSNAQGAEFLARLNHPGLKRVILGHLSRRNNLPELAAAAASAAIEGGPGSPAVTVACQHEPTPLFEI
ncbi:MAG: MBL fold metallo-hydrolase [Deltaproteobacteria bacterium]|jgi:phosphoribosyl 1,2-cyclic phosphodiesterase|nr:MBL fold metallo-hydrolase [Deltaproteobacteria bacterium]